MALGRKNRRTLHVDGHTYHWVASGNDGWIDLYIMLDDDGRGGGQKLHCQFDYASDRIARADGSASLRQRRKVTPDVVRQVIAFGLEHGWTPTAGGVCRLGHVDDAIDFGL